jgi:hypothetical protein
VLLLLRRIHTPFPRILYILPFLDCHNQHYDRCLHPRSVRRSWSLPNPPLRLLSGRIIPGLTHELGGFAFYGQKPLSFFL